MGDCRLTLRPMSQDDLALVAHWLVQPHVAPWWSDDPDGQVADMRAELASGGPSVYRVAELDGQPVGLLFRYRIHDYPEYADELMEAHLVVPGDAWSMDYLVGEATATGRGVGTAMIRLAAGELWASEADAECVIVPVHADNERSWHALRHAGFTVLPIIFHMEPDTASHDRRHVVCRLDRPHPRHTREAVNAPGGARSPDTP